MKANQEHQTVLRKSAVAGLNIKSSGAYIDATFGRGGHSRGILEELDTHGRLLVLDRDPDAIAEANSLASQDGRVTVCHCEFSRMESAAREWINEGFVDGILLDLGVSSPQLDDAERGFSFMRSGPLDMRMNPHSGMTAAQWINTATAEDIADVLYRYGEERHSRRIARAITAARSEAAIATTTELAGIIQKASPSREREKHPATRAFQAIRIFINDELGQLNAALQQALTLLAPGGRLVVISFHSLEDRIVKNFMAKQTKGDSLPRHLPVTSDQFKPLAKTIGKKIKPDAVELEQNPRSRSAVMRIMEKL